MTDPTHVVNRILYIGESPGGRFYSKEILEQVLEGWNAAREKGTELFTYVTERKELVPNLADIAGVVSEMWVDDEGLVVATKVMDTPRGKALFNFLNQEDNAIEIIPQLTGVVGKESEVTQATLVSIFITYATINKA